MTTTTRITIYGLYDPRDEYHVRYVGLAVNPELRWRRHVAEAKGKKKDSYKLRWMRKVLGENVIPRWRQIAVTTSVLDGARVEAILIDQHRAAGHRITNVAPGGNGILLTPEQFEQWMLKMRSPEYRAAASAALKGRPKTPEHVAKVRAAITGRVKSATECANIKAAKNGSGKTILTAVARAKISDKLKGRRKSLEHAAKLRSVLRSSERRAKMSASGKSRVGEKRSPETCARISASKKGCIISAETRAKNSAKHTGIKRSARSRANIAAGQRRRFENRWETMAYMMATA